MIKVKRIYEDSKLPLKANETDVGYDVFAHSIDLINNSLVYKLGIAVEPPEGYYFQLCARSSMSNFDWVLPNAFGIIDPSFRGELQMRLKPIGKVIALEDTKKEQHLDCNFTSRRVVPFNKGERIGQLVLCKLYNFQIEESDLSETERGTGGFGSTGK